MPDEMTGLPDGFVPHDGGEMPVPPETMVEIIMQAPNGHVYHREGDDQAAWFDTLNWWVGSERWRIIAYRKEQNNAD